MTDDLSGPASVDQIQTGTLPIFADHRGSLGVLEFPKWLPLVPVRLFWITDVPAGMTRGGHAHKRCAQFMICQGGRIHVDTYDGVRERSFELKAGDYLHLPPGIYASETYIEPHSRALVLCDYPFEVDDYIDDREALTIRS